VPQSSLTASALFTRVEKQAAARRIACKPEPQHRIYIYGPAAARAIFKSRGKPAGGSAASSS
jgi:hypothetical protein